MSLTIHPITFLSSSLTPREPLKLHKPEQKLGNYNMLSPRKLSADPPLPSKRFYSVSKQSLLFGEVHKPVSRKVPIHKLVADDAAAGGGGGGGGGPSFMRQLACVPGRSGFQSLSPNKRREKDDQDFVNDEFLSREHQDGATLFANSFLGLGGGACLEEDTFHEAVADTSLDDSLERFSSSIMSAAPAPKSHHSHLLYLGSESLATNSSSNNNNNSNKSNNDNECSSLDLLTSPISTRGQQAKSSMRHRDREHGEKEKEKMKKHANFQRLELPETGSSNKIIMDGIGSLDSASFIVTSLLQEVSKRRELLEQQQQQEHQLNQQQHQQQQQQASVAAAELSVVSIPRVLLENNGKSLGQSSITASALPSTVADETLSKVVAPFESRRLAAQPLVTMAPKKPILFRLGRDGEADIGEDFSFDITSTQIAHHSSTIKQASLTNSYHNNSKPMWQLNGPPPRSKSRRLQRTKKTGTDGALVLGVSLAKMQIEKQDRSKRLKQGSEAIANMDFGSESWSDVSASLSIIDELFSKASNEATKTEAESAAFAAVSSAVSASDVYNSNGTSPFLALQHRSSELTTSELSEILNYPRVYFLGDLCVKQQGTYYHVHEEGGLGCNNNKSASSSKGLPNGGFDDLRGDYIVAKGDHIAFRYEVLDILGAGSFGAVYKCKDHAIASECAIKVIRNKRRFNQQAEVELAMLLRLKGGGGGGGVGGEGGGSSDTAGESAPEAASALTGGGGGSAHDGRRANCIQILNDFEFRNHKCFVFPLFGLNLYEFLKAKNFRGCTMRFVRLVATQLLQCLAHLRRNNIIHCDLKPENILIKDEKTASIVVIDFGSSCLANETVYSYIQSRFYRAPEIIMGLDLVDDKPKYGHEIDMWSFATILPELRTAWPAFPGEDESDQLACIAQVLGHPPQNIVQRCTRKSTLFEEASDGWSEVKITTSPKGQQRIPGSRPFPDLIGKKGVATSGDTLFIDFLKKCLTWDPAHRLTPDQALAHAWVEKGEVVETKAAALQVGVGEVTRVREKIVVPSLSPFPFTVNSNSSNNNNTSPLFYCDEMEIISSPTAPKQEKRSILGAFSPGHRVLTISTDTN